MAGLAHDRPEDLRGWAGLAHDRPEGLRGLFATERRWSRKSLAGPEHVLKFWPV